jgi:hypothetical protein
MDRLLPSLCGRIRWCHPPARESPRARPPTDRFHCGSRAEDSTLARERAAHPYVSIRIDPVVARAAVRRAAAPVRDRFNPRRLYRAVCYASALQNVVAGACFWKEKGDYVGVIPLVLRTQTRCCSGPQADGPAPLAWSPKVISDLNCQVAPP